MTLTDDTTPTSTLTEEQALKRLVRATGGAACAVHEVSPVANHLVGRVSALRPADHPSPPPALARSQTTADALIHDSTGIAGEIKCTCVTLPNPSLFVVPGVSEGAIARPARHDDASQVEVDKAIRSGDVEMALPVLDPRLDALKLLADRARAESGGTLDPDVREAVEVLARTLVGSTRWNVVSGWEEGFAWPVPWRFGSAAITGHCFLLYDEIATRIMRRLLDGK
jgi:hypothetical protein